jgi:hypothetical protein
MLPRGWGRAYYDFYRDRMLIMPVPFNLIVGLARKLWFNSVAGVKPDVITRAYKTGFAAGRASCHRNLGVQIADAVHRALRNAK